MSKLKSVVLKCDETTLKKLDDIAHHIEKKSYLMFRVQGRKNSYYKVTRQVALLHLINDYMETVIDR